VVGEQVRVIDSADRAALERDSFQFNVNFILGGQVGDEEHDLYLIYPQGNPLRATKDSPYLQTGEHKYGRPILVRGIHYDSTPLEEAAKYAIISMDSTMRSNVTVGPPVDLVLYRKGELDITRQRRLTASDPDFVRMHTMWDLGLRKVIHDLPGIDFETIGQKAPAAPGDPVKEDSIHAPK
jgi:putative proteasome-type protease